MDRAVEIFRHGLRRAAASFAAAAAIFTAGCTKQSLETTYSSQENRIDSFITSQLESNENYSILHNPGSNRLIISGGSGNALGRGGTVSFYYAGYVLSSASLSAANLFATNSEETADASGWQLSGDNQFDILTLNIDNEDIVEGLRYGLEGVRAGQECYILFSGKYGFGKKPLGTIPANAALAYHIWVESIANE